MKDFGKYIIEKLKVSKHISSEINVDTFKHGIKLYDVSFLSMQTISYRGCIYITY